MVRNECHACPLSNLELPYFALDMYLKAGAFTRHLSPTVYYVRGSVCVCEGVCVCVCVCVCEGGGVCVCVCVCV